MKRKIFGIPAYFFYLLMAVSLLGIILASFFDLSFSKAIVDANDPLGNFFETFGLFLSYTAIELAVIYIFVGLYRREKILWRIVSYFWLILPNLYLIYNFSDFFYLDPKSEEVLFGFRYESRILSFVIAALFIIASAVAIFLLIDKKKENENLCFVLGVACAAALALRLGFTSILKGLAGRPRYRFLFEIGATHDGVVYTYKDWWQFSFFSSPHLDYFESWPSGHTMNAALSLTFITLPGVMKKRFKGDRYVCFGVGVLYTLLMAFYRVRVGAHWLSDVSFGMLLGTVIVFATMYLAEIYKEKVLPKKEEPEVNEAK